MTIGVLVSLLILLAAGLPIFIGLAATVFVHLGVFSDVPLTIVPQRMFAGIDSFTLMAIPFFNLAAEIMRSGRLSDRLIDLARTLVGFLPGGLGMAAVLACMLFACISGSSPATVIAAGSILVPALIKAGYGKRFSIGLLTTAGSLGILIPPSVTFIIYGVVTGTSIGALFLAGVVPGLLVGLMLMIYCFAYARRSGLPSDPIPPFRTVVAAIRRAGWVLGLPVIVLGGIYGGIFTPTEAAAVSAAYSLLVAMFVYRSLRPSDLAAVLTRSGLVSGALLLVIAAASAFSWLITSQNIPQAIAAAALSGTSEPWLILLVFNIVLLGIGCFLESASAIVILMPLVMPIAQQIGIDPVHLGVITIMNMEIGMVTPPVGLNLMVAKLMTDLPLGEIIRAVLPTMAILLVGLLFVTYLPWLSLWLPRLAYG